MGYDEDLFEYKPKSKDDTGKTINSESIINQQGVIGVCFNTLSHEGCSILSYETIHLQIVQPDGKYFR